MKTTKQFVLMAFAALTLGFTFTSCSSDDNDAAPSTATIRQHIVGTWKLDTRKNVPIITNDKQVFTFNADGTLTHSLSLEVGTRKRYIWHNHMTGKYTFENNVINMVRIDSTGENSTITAINDKQMNWINNYIIIRKNAKRINNYPETVVKVNVDYKDAIVGLWEGVSLTGEETYGDANHRIEYLADGTYIYYNKVDGKWEPKPQEENMYNVHGDWLATRWKDSADADYNYEWWDIVSCNNSSMVWSALREREDGTTFTTTFTWKRIK